LKWQINDDIKSGIESSSSFAEFGNACKFLKCSVGSSESEKTHSIDLYATHIPTMSTAAMLAIPTFWRAVKFFQVVSGVMHNTTRTIAPFLEVAGSDIRK